MRYLKKYEKLDVQDIIGPTFHKETDIQIRKLYPDSWKDLQLYRIGDIEKLFKIYSFERHFDDALHKSLKDLYGQNCISIGDVKVDDKKKKELVLLLINGLNWYCFLKKMYDKQIVLPWLRVIDIGQVDSICWTKEFQKGIDRFFEYLWGFRTALFARSETNHRDVMYLQRNIYVKVYNGDYISRKPILLSKGEPLLGGL